MKCQTLFWVKIIVNFSSVEFATSVLQLLTIKALIKTAAEDILNFFYITIIITR